MAPKRDTAAVFDWLMSALSYQGISDRIAAEYKVIRHGGVCDLFSEARKFGLFLCCAIRLEALFDGGNPFEPARSDEEVAKEAGAF
jgi:hypothetical protein